MKLESYWLDSAPGFSSFANELPDRADVVIIGAGFTGLSSALALARRGASVVVLEKERVLGEASGRNGGQCNNGTAQSLSSLIQSHGSEKAKAFYQSYNQAVDSVEALVKREKIDCGFTRCGKLKLAAKPKHFESLRTTASILKQEGVDPDVELISASELSNEVSGQGFYGALLYPQGAQMHVGKFGMGLAESAKREGVKIFENAQVGALKKISSNEWLVSTPKGEISAAQVLVATGGSGPGPFSWFRRRIIPVGSFAVVTEPLTEELVQQVFPGKRNYVTTRHIGNYFRLSEDNRLLFGGRARFAVSNPKSDKQSAVILRQSLAQLFPQLKNVGFDYCWGGSVDMSADRLPRMGQHDGLYYAMGYSGHGVQMAVHMGELMADMINGNVEDNPWVQMSWPAIPGHFGKPWFLPAVGLYYKILDKLQ